MAPTAACSYVFAMQMAVMCHGAEAKDGERGTTTCRDYRRSDWFRQVIRLPNRTGIKDAYLERQPETVTNTCKALEKHYFG